MSPVKESSLAHEQLEPKTEDVDTNMSAPEAPTPALTNIVAEPEMDAAGMDIAEPIAEPAPEAVDDGGE